MKNLLAYLYNKTPFKREAYQLIKLIYAPPRNIYKYLRFRSVFKVKIANTNGFSIYQNNLPLERQLFWEGIYGYEKKTMELWIELSKDADYIFDIGANTGLFSLAAKCVNPESKIYAFEPLKRIFSLLNGNILINNYDINRYNIAISNETGKTVLYDYADTKDGSMASLNSNFRRKNQIPNFIHAITLDEFIIKYKISNIDLMKVDVETFEPEVIEGFLKHINIFKPYIFIEVLDQRVATALNDLIDYSFYLVFNINDKKGLCPKPYITSDIIYRNYFLCPKEKFQSNPIIGTLNSR